jgi:hypothetical protein
MLVGVEVKKAAGGGSGFATAAVFGFVKLSESAVAHGDAHGFSIVVTEDALWWPIASGDSSGALVGCGATVATCA